MNQAIHGWRQPIFPEQYTQARRVSRNAEARLPGQTHSGGGGGWGRYTGAPPLSRHTPLEGGDCCTVAWQPLPRVLALCFQSLSQPAAGPQSSLGARVSGLC